MGHAAQRLLFFIDPVEGSSYPATETGYAMVYRAFVRAEATGGEVYVAYPDAAPVVSLRGSRTPLVRVDAHRVSSFVDPPYAHYRGYRAAQSAGVPVDVGRCHEEAQATPLVLNDLDAVIWRQERGEPAQRGAQLRALRAVESDTLIYLAPRLALDPRFASKVIPDGVERRFRPRSFCTSWCPAEATARERAVAIVQFLHESLQDSSTVIAKTVVGDEDDEHVFGFNPITQRRECKIDDLSAWTALIQRCGDLVVQEYVPSVRAPDHEPGFSLSRVPHQRRDFGEVRFLLIDGQVPRDEAGFPYLVARSVPTGESLSADSGVSYPTSLSAAELSFLSTLGPLYRRWGIHFGGGDLIRTGDVERPFVFTDAARSVCGHAVVMGALNGEPYVIVDQVLDSVGRQIELHHNERAEQEPLSEAGE
jgi:hypothetical protein